MRTFRTLTVALLLAMLGAIPIVPAQAGNGYRHHGDHDKDHDRARRAFRQGDILPLADLLARSGVEDKGRLIEVELEDEHGRMIYELKLLTPEGRVLEYLFDARSGHLLKVEGEDD